MKYHRRAAAKFKMIGYDIRVSADHLRVYWPNDVRLKHLLRPEVDMPLSVDPIGRPTIFDVSTNKFLPVEEKLTYGMACLPHPKEAFIWTGWWLDKAELEHYISQYHIGGNTFLIGVSSAHQLNMFDQYVPNRGYRDPNWSFKGYDVASQFMDSGLTSWNLRGNYPDIQAEFEDKLNEYGLFTNKAWAEKLRWRFEEIFDEAFFVYGLHIIRELSWPP